eukprot:Hpha_TRINITY_DN27937_c0_g1::TRINITY_DN27937_c0_g1_i1::g.45009::m.45009
MTTRRRNAPEGAKKPADGGSKGPPRPPSTRPKLPPLRGGGTQGSGWRKFFVIPAVGGTYFWLTYLLAEGAAQSRNRQGVWRYDLTTAFYKVPAKVLERMCADESARAAVMEWFFLTLFGMAATHLIYPRASFIAFYTFASVCSTGAFPIALCNHLFPLSEPEPKKKVELSEEEQKKRWTLPHLQHLLFSVLALGAVGYLVTTEEIHWRIAVLIPASLLVLPLILAIVKINPEPGPQVLRGRTLLLFGVVWAVAGAVLVTRTRTALPIWDKPLTDIMADPWGWFEFVKRRLNPFLSGKALHAVPPLGFLGFLAQIGAFSVGAAAFIMLDSDGGVPLVIRLLFMVAIILAPTAAAPLYFGVRTYK